MPNRIVVTALAFAALVFAPVAAALEVKVSYSEDFQKALAEDYGDREGELLSARVTRQIEQAFDRAGIDVARVDVVINEAKPSKPTFKQLGDEPGLDFGLSVSAGGMDLSAVAFDAAGTPVSNLDYKWFESDLRNPGLSTWYDANRASDRFARKFAKQIARGS
jgi:hypothetical protein